MRAEMDTASITYVEADGERTIVAARIGQTLMEAATKGGVRGIAADCGGNCSCGTCRIHPAPEWQDRLGPVSEIEAEMLEFADDSHPGARLSCRIEVTQELDGLIVALPASQH